MDKNFPLIYPVDCMMGFRFVSIFICLITLCWAVESPSDFEPDQLTPQWWETFSTSPGNLEQKSSQLISHIHFVTPTMTESKQAEVKELTSRLQVNFNNLARLQTLSPPAIPQATPLAETYPIDETLELDRKVRSDTLELKSLKDERHEKLGQIDALQDQLDRLTKVYFRTHDRTEERFILGLKLINAQVALTTAKEELSRLDKTIKGYEGYLKRLKEEVIVAEKRLISSPEEVQEDEKKNTLLLKQWQESEVDLRHKEAEPKHNGGGEAQLFDQELMQTQISELLAHQQYIAGEIKAALAKLLIYPEDLRAKDLVKKIKEWNGNLSEFSQKSEDLAHVAERQIQRTAQILSLNPQSEGGFIMTMEQRIIRLAQSNLIVLQRVDSEIEDSRFLLGQLETHLTDHLGGTERLTQWIGGHFSNFWMGLSDWFNRPLFYIGTTPIQFSGLLKFFIILLFTVWVSDKIVNWFTRLTIAKNTIQKSVLYRLSRLIYYFLLTLGLIFALTSLGFDFSNFLLIAGALGVGLGFGLQTIFNNFISGLILLFESHIKVGDFIEIASGVRGEVKEINVRSTIIAMNDGLDAIIPNSEMISNRVVNWTLSHPYRRIKVPFTVAYGTDKELVRKVILEAALNAPHSLIKPGFSDPSVLLAGLDPPGLQFELHVWVNEKYSKLPGQAMSFYLWAIANALKENGIEIPFPRTDIKTL